MWREVLNFTLKNGSTLVATQANVWQGSLTVEQAVSSEGAFEIGSTHIGQMTVTLADIEASRISNAVFSINSEGHLILDGERVSYQTVYANTDFTDAVVVVYMAQNADDLQQMGVYNVVSAVRDEGTISITAYDNVTKLSVPYETSLSFPSTYGAMANEICGQVMTFDGSTTAVATKPEGEDLTKREVLGYIAQACGYNVLCDNMGRFQFVRYNLSGFSTEGQYHAISSLYDFHHSQYPVVITGAKVIVVTTVDTTDPDTGEVTSEEVTNTYTSGTDDYQIVIEGNPLITTANGQAVADLIFATYGGVSFYTGTVSHISDLTIKASDIMKVTDRLGNTYPMLVSSTRISTGAAQSTGSYAEEPASKLSVQPTELSRVQNSVRQALLDAKNGQNKANYASRLASNTNQYFWHTETGSDTGAHITEIPQEDFLEDPANGGGNLLARSNGIAVRDGLEELATFGAGYSTIGKTNNAHLQLTFNDISLVDKNGAAIFNVRDLRNETGTATVTEIFHAKDVSEFNGNYFMQLSLRAANTDYTVTPSASDITVTGRSTINVYISRMLVANETVTVTYQTTDARAITFTFGKRRTDSVDGISSFAVGYDVEASGMYSVAMGAHGQATGKASAVFGWSALANSEFAMASGFQAEASGFAAVAQNCGTVAKADYQTAMGQYNSIDYNDEYALIVGNGDSPSNRSNALTVDWDGNVAMSGDLTASNVGAVYSNAADAAISSTNIDTYTVGASVTVPAGVYVITAYWTFQSVSGARICDIDISTDSGTTATGYIARQRVSNATGNWSRLNVTTIGSFASQTTLYVKGSSNVAYTSAAPTRIMAVRIR